MTNKLEEIAECGRCGANLKDPKSVARGFGRTCYRKHLAAEAMRAEHAQGEVGTDADN